MRSFNHDWRVSDPRLSPGPPSVPKACPTCGSALIVTTSKDPGDSTYWRCRDCGEIWNAARHRENGRGRPR